MQRNQLLRFGFGVDDQPVGLVDHLLFTDRAQRRLGSVAVGQRRVLHRGQGVRGVHERDRPSVACQPTHLTRQPVMRMHDVVVAGLVGGLGAQYACGEGAQLGGQVVFVQAFERAGDDVANEHPGATWTTGASVDDVALVKISTSTPRRAMCSALCRT